MSDHIEMLAQKARETGDREDMLTLWKATFALDEWAFVSQGEMPNVHPFAGMIEDKPMIFGFTDEERARGFAAKHNLGEEDGSTPLLVMPIMVAVEMIETLGQHGVFGVLFNEGPNGFFSPVEQMRPMMEHFSQEGPDDTAAAEDSSEEE